MKNNKKGFTLIELLVVIAIIGLLSTLSIVALNSARARSRDARRVSDIKQIQTALEMYYNVANAYPATTSAGIVYGSTTFMTVLPTAPTPADGSVCQTGTNNTYTYAQIESGASYTLTYCLGETTGGIPAGVRTASPSGISQ